jgi:SAM-dependent methyltransferase
MKEVNQCTVCGASVFTNYTVLWDDLEIEWELTSYEIDYINRQQGRCCGNCGNNMRSLALAYAITRSFSYSGTLVQFVESEMAQGIRVLEINETGGLSPILSKLPLHSLISYPSYDMSNLAVPSDSFDLVIHSDTLEHIPQPIVALSECCRVLADAGRCIFTIPIVVGRLSKSRTGMKNSFHGSKGQTDIGYLVHTEFGADMWTYAIEAGFTGVKIHSLEYPAAFAIEATR